MSRTPRALSLFLVLGAGCGNEVFIEASSSSSSGGASPKMTSSVVGSTASVSATSAEGGAPPACFSAADCPAPGKACLEAACVDGLCQVAQQPSGIACEDGDLCTSFDFCQNG